MKSLLKQVWITVPSFVVMNMSYLERKRWRINNVEDEQEKMI